MLKKSVTYRDFNGEEVTEDFFFHLSKAELVELEMSREGGLSAAMQKIMDTNDGRGIIEEFKKILLMAYGKKSSDGRRFIKNDELRQEFQSSEGYSVLFMELMTNATAAAEFVNGIIPDGLAEDAAKIAGADLTVVPDKKHVSRKEAQEMSQQELLDGLSSGNLVLED